MMSNEWARSELAGLARRYLDAGVRLQYAGSQREPRAEILAEVEENFRRAELAMISAMRRAGVRYFALGDDTFKARGPRVNHDRLDVILQSGEGEV